MLRRKVIRVAKKKAKQKMILSRVMKFINFICSIGAICSLAKILLNLVFSN